MKGIRRKLGLCDEIDYIRFGKYSVCVFCSTFRALSSRKKGIVSVEMIAL